MPVVCLAPRPLPRVESLEQRVPPKRISVNMPVFLRCTLQKGSKRKDSSRTSFEQVFLMHDAKAFDIIGKAPLLLGVALSISGLETEIVGG